MKNSAETLEHYNLSNITRMKIARGQMNPNLNNLNSNEISQQIKSLFNLFSKQIKKKKLTKKINGFEKKIYTFEEM